MASSLEILNRIKERSQSAQQSADTRRGSGQEASGGSSQEILDRIKQRNSGTLDTDWSTPEYSWMKRYNDVLNRVGAYSAQRRDSWTADASGGNMGEIDALLKEYDSFSGDQSAIRKQRDFLSKYREQLTGVTDFFNQFQSQDDYDRQRSGYTNYGVGYTPASYGLEEGQARTLRKEQSQKDAKEAQRALAELDSARKAFSAVDAEWKAMDDKYRSFTIDEYDQGLTERWQAAKEKVTAAENALLNARNRMNAYNAGWGKVDQYADTTEAARGTATGYSGPSYTDLVDWENNRQVEQLREEASATRTDYVPGNSNYTEATRPQIEDRLGLWRSMTDEQRDYAASSPNQQLAQAVLDAQSGNWDLLTDREVETYYYIRQQQGQDAADKYLDDMTTELSRRNDSRFIEDLENANGLQMAGYNVLSIAGNVLGSAPAGIGKAGELVSGKQNPYSSSSMWKRYASYIRGTTGEKIEDWSKEALKFSDTAAKFANNTYQAVMSGFDSAAGAMLFGRGLGIPVGRFGLHVGGYTTVMGLGAFADRAQELQLKGATPAQIALGAVGSGVLEALLEDISLEAFVSNILENPATTLKEFGKKLAVQMGVEASEEVFTEIGNMMWDSIVMGKNADNQQAVRDYMDQGMTEQAARAQVAKDNALDIFWAGYGGAVSAGAMSAAGQFAASAYRGAQNTAGNFAVGSQLLENGQVVNLENQARELAVSKKSGKLVQAAQEVARTYRDGDPSLYNTYKTGKVATDIARQAGKEAARAKSAEFRAAAEKYLEGRNDVADKKRALNVLSRMFSNDTRLPGDKTAYQKLGGDRTVQAILDSAGGKEAFDARVDERRAASMRTTAGVQAGVLGYQVSDTGNIEYRRDGDGVALKKGTAEPVQITGISGTKGGLVLKTGDGQTVSVRDVVAGSRGEAAVLNAIDFMDTNSETANALWQASKLSDLDGEAFAKGLKDAYLQGRVGASYESIRDYSYAGKLTDAQRRMAWTEGREARNVYTKAQAQRTDSGALKAAQKGVTVQDSAKELKTLNKQQRAGMAAANALAAAGLHVEVYASTAEDRANGMPNGTYQKRDGSIAVDLNAGNDGQGSVAYALAHETTHFIKDFSAEKYQSYADLLISEAEKEGIRYNSLLARAFDRVSGMEEYKGISEKQLHDIAYDETIAEMSEMMLTDTDAAGRIAGKLKAQDRTLWEKIKDFFTGLVERLRNAYQDAEPDSEIARILKRAVQDNEALAEAWASAVVDAGENYQLQKGTVIGTDGNSADYLYSNRVTDKKTLDFLDGQETVTTYKTMQLVDGKLYPPMAAVVAGSYEDYSELGKWEAATEHPELIKLDKSGKPKFTLNKGKGQGSLAAAYNPYMHSSNLVLNDQFSGAYTRPNLVTVECRVPVSELTSGYKAQHAKDSVGWHSWHTGTVAGALRQQTGTERQVLLSRWIMPMRIVPDAEVAQMYKQLLDGTNIAVPDNVVPPALLTELKKAGVAISESGRIQEGQKKNAQEGVRYSRRYMEAAENQEITDLVDKVNSGYFNGNEKVFLRNVSDQIAGRIYDITGVNVDGYRVAIEARQVEHILKGHGENGDADHSMADQKNIAKIEYVLNNPDSIIPAGTTRAYVSNQNGRNKPARTVLYEKSIGEKSYYAVQAIADTKAKTLYIVSAFIGEKGYKKGTSQSTDTKSPSATPEAESARVPTPIVAQDNTDVNGENIRKSSRSSQNFPENQTETESFKNWFGDWQNAPASASKVVNADGTPKVLYHQTAENFTIFEPRHQGAGTRDSDTPFGIFMKSSDKNIGVKGEKQMALYAKIVNPLTVIDRADLINQLKKISPEYVKAADELRGLNAAYQKKHDDATKAFRDYILEWRKAHPDASRTALYDDAGFNEVYEAEDNILDEWESEARKVELRSKEAITRDLENNGYDGVIIQFDKGSFGRSTDAYIALHPEQVKSATDNIGTFDPNNPDIRYSQRTREGTQVDRLAKQNEVLGKEVEYLKQLVNIQKRGNKDHILDRNSVNQQGRILMEGVNAKGGTGEFNRMLNDFYREISTTDMDFDTMKEKAGALADWLLEHHQAEKDSYAQEILDFLAKRRVSLNEGQTGDIEYGYGSLNDFKKAIKGSVILDQNAATSLDQLWQEAAERFPDKFAADTVDADMPDGLASVVEWANSSESAGEAEWQYYRAENRNDLIEKVLQGYWNAEPVKSVADKSRAEIARLKQEHKTAMEEARKEKRQAVADERARSNAAIEAYRAQRDAMDKAQKGLYEADRRMIEQQYAKQMKQLRGQYSEDTKTMQTEFFRLLREYDKQQTRNDRQNSLDAGTIQDLRARLKQEADSHREDSAAWNQEFNRLLREYDASGRRIDKLETKVKQQREAAQAKVESRRRTEERAKIQKTLDTLNRYLLHPTDTVHVPDNLQSSVAMALEAANSMILESKSGRNSSRLAEYAKQLQKLEGNPSANEAQIRDLNRKIQNLTRQDGRMKSAVGELMQQYRELKGNMLYDENIAEMISDCYKEVGDTAYKDLSLTQLQTVKDTYRALLTTIQNANHAFTAGRNANIQELVNRTRRELEAQPKQKAEKNSMGQAIDKFLWNNEKPIYAFNRIGSATLTELYSKLRGGEDTWARDVSDAKAYFTGAAARHGYDKWNFGALETFTASDGTQFQLDLDERMSVYAYSLREQAREHLLKGGITLNENTQRAKKGPLGTIAVTYDDANAYALTEETLNAITQSLSPEQRAFAREMQQYLSTVMGAKGNEVSMALYGIKKFNEQYYWPIKSSGRFSEAARLSQEQVGNKLKNKGYTKRTVEHASNPIEISGFIDTWADHVSDMSMYHAFTLPMEDFYRVYNWHETGDGMGGQSVGMRQLIEQTHGKGAAAYIDQFLKDLNGGVKADPRAEVNRKMLSGFKKAAVSASLSVAIQQPSAVGRAFAYIEANYFLGSKVEGVKGIEETWEQMKQYAPGVTVAKDMGRFDMDMGASVQDYIMGKQRVGTWAKITDKIDEAAGWLPENADKVTWCQIWEAAKRKTAATNPSLKGEALLHKAGELFSETIQKTQVYDSVFSRSGNMRAKDTLSVMTTAFMAEPTTTANMAEEAVRKFRQGDRRMGAKMVSAVATATVLNAVLASFVYAMRDKDEDKTYWEKYLASLTAETLDSFNPLTYIPILNDINSLLGGYSVSRTDLTLASDAIDSLKRTVTLYSKQDPDANEEEQRAWDKKIRDAWVSNLLTVGNFAGLPLKNIYRDVSGMVNTWKNPSKNAEMSVDTILEAMRGSAKQNLPVVSWIADDSNSDQLYEAITAGKTVLASRIKTRFKDDQAYENAVRKGLRDNDPRIHQAAEYVLSMETEKRVRITKEIVAEKHFDQDTVIKAINAEANSMKQKSQSGKDDTPEKLYDTEEYVNAQSKGLGYAKNIQEGIVAYNTDRILEDDPKLGKERAKEKAVKQFQSSVKRDTKLAYQDGTLDDTKAGNVLVSADILDQDEVKDTLLGWKTQVQLGDSYDWADTKYVTFAKFIQPSGISADVYDDFLREEPYIEGEDLNGDGKTDSGTLIRNKAIYINSLPLTAAQKDVLWDIVTEKSSKKTKGKYRLW